MTVIQIVEALTNAVIGFRNRRPGAGAAPVRRTLSPWVTSEWLVRPEGEYAPAQISGFHRLDAVIAPEQDCHEQKARDPCQHHPQNQGLNGGHAYLPLTPAHRAAYWICVRPSLRKKLQVLKKSDVDAGNRIMAPSSCVGLAMASTASTWQAGEDRTFRNRRFTIHVSLRCFCRAPADFFSHMKVIEPYVPVACDDIDLIFAPALMAPQPVPRCVSGWRRIIGADMSPRTVFATFLIAFAIASVCAGLTTAKQVYEQASNARIITRG